MTSPNPKLPEFITKTYSEDEYAKLTPDDLKRMSDELQMYNAAVRTWNRTIRGAHIAFIDEAKKLYGPNDRVTKYLANNPPQAITYCEYSMSSFTDKYKSYQDAMCKREEQRKETELLVNAVIFLTQHGMVAGTDFYPHTAVTVANNIRFEELVREKIDSGDGFFDFSGQNCDSCSGWDGESRRCNCGNRRVGWTYEGNFTDMYIYGEAW